jgi:hypothetical protein
MNSADKRRSSETRVRVVVDYLRKITAARLAHFPDDAIPFKRGYCRR